MQQNLPLRQDVELAIEGDATGFEIALEETSILPGVTIVRVRLHSDQIRAAPEPLQLTLKYPARDVQGLWHPGIDERRYQLVPWAHNGGAGYTSSAFEHAPVFALHASNDDNRLTVASSELVHSVRLGAFIKEEPLVFAAFVQFFARERPAFSSYEVELRIDARPVKLSEVLRDVSAWWLEKAGVASLPVPAAAAVPYYSTWYSFHKDLRAAEIERECALARDLGCEAVIVDDGWYLDDPRAFAEYCGDWQVETKRFPDFAEHVARVRALGMRYVLWLALPLVGVDSRAHERLQGKFIGSTHWRSDTPDPRSVDVRKYCEHVVERLLTESSLDGLKLDFLEQFRAGSAVDLPADGDDPSIETAALALLEQVIERAKTLRPELLVEFRQPYTGPRMQRFANMFRANDCVYSIVVNRVRTLDLRSLAAPSAVVHGDMLAFRADEPVEAAALQLLAVFFAVPQISVRLATLGHDHREMVAHLLAVWKRYRAALLWGRLGVRQRELGYTAVRATADGLAFTVIYAEVVVSAEAALPGSFGLGNASDVDRVSLFVEAPLSRRRMRITSCTGKLLKDEVVDLATGICTLDVPRGGILELLTI